MNQMEVRFSPKQYLRITGPNRCQLQISPHNTRQWRMGNTFLRSYYTIYDSVQRQVGIAGTGVTVPDSELKKIVVTPVIKKVERTVQLKSVEPKIDREVKWIIPVGISVMICLIILGCCCVKSCS